MVSQSLIGSISYTDSDKSSNVKYVAIKVTGDVKSSRDTSRNGDTHSACDVSRYQTQYTSK